LIGVFLAFLRARSSVPQLIDVEIFLMLKSSYRC